MASNSGPTCPKCTQADHVQKVSNLYDANTEDWSEEELGMDVFGHVEDRQVQHEAHTRLGLKLKPPEEPEPPTQPGFWYIFGIGMAILVLLGVCPITVIFFAIFIPVVSSNSSTLPAAIRGQNGTNLIWGMIIFVLVALGLLVWLGFVIRRRYRRAMADYHNKQEAFEQDQLRPYQRAKERWEQLYFCKRCTVVFIPSENKAVPMEDMNKYIKDAHYDI